MNDLIKDQLRYNLRSTILRRPLVNLRHRDITDKDCFLASYPKSGNTWVKFMLSQLMIGKELDFDHVEDLIPMVGDQNSAPVLLSNGGKIIKTHEPYMKSYKQAIYIIRDGRDVAVSYYYHQLREGMFKGTFSEFLTQFIKGKVDGYSCWKNHVLTWMAAPIQEDNGLLIIKYEDMLSNPFNTLGNILGFLKVPIEDKEIQSAIESNTKEKMRQKEHTSSIISKSKRKDISFVRSGVQGDWKDTFSNDDIKKFNDFAGDILVRFGYTVEER